MALIKINAGGFDGETGVITFFPCTGGTINLGTHIMPYFYDTDYFLGVYSIYFPSLLKTCTTEIPCTYNNVILKINNQDFKQYDCGELVNIDILNNLLQPVGTLDALNNRVIVTSPPQDIDFNGSNIGQLDTLNDVDVNLIDSANNTVTPLSFNLTGNTLTIEVLVTIYEHDYISPYSYCGKAPIGTPTSSSIWEIARIEIFLDGTTDIKTSTGEWDNRTTLIYN
jgi:hypothetical protein